MSRRVSLDWEKPTIDETGGKPTKDSEDPNLLDSCELCQNAGLLLTFLKTGQRNPCLPAISFRKAKRRRELAVKRRHDSELRFSWGSHRLRPLAAFCHALRALCHSIVSPDGQATPQPLAARKRKRNANDFSLLGRGDPRCQ